MLFRSALALLGNFLLAVSAKELGDGHSTLVFTDLLVHAKQLNPVWLMAAFIFMLIGYGTKMGLAPMHTWLPDAHSEAPAPLSALLSGSLLNCAMLAIFRCHVLCVGSGLGRFSNNLLVLFGLLSLAVAAVFILRQRDYKRMLAYSSIAHAGYMLMVLPVLSSDSIYAVMLYLFVYIFMNLGAFFTVIAVKNITGGETFSDFKGIGWKMPIVGLVMTVFMFSLTGLPPTAGFIGKFYLFAALIEGGTQF